MGARVPQDYWVVVDKTTGWILGCILHPTPELAKKNLKDGVCSVNKPRYTVCRAEVRIYSLDEKE